MKYADLAVPEAIDLLRDVVAVSGQLDIVDQVGVFLKGDAVKEDLLEYLLSRGLMVTEDYGTRAVVSERGREFLGAITDWGITS